MDPAARPPPSAPRRFPRGAYDWAWLLFLVWTAVGFVVMPLGVTSAQARVWAAPLGLGGAAAAILAVSDAVWMLLAAVTVYLHAVADEGLRTARRQATLVLLASTACEWVGARTGFPFGPYEYTANFGPRIAGVVPMAIPLAWLVVVLCGRNVVLLLYPPAGRLAVAAGTAVAATLTDLNLEPVAWHVRQYWVWYPLQDPPPSSLPPWQNYAAWFVLSFVLACALPTDHALRSRRPSRLRPVLLLVVLNALLALVHLSVNWRHPVPNPAARPSGVTNSGKKAGLARSATGVTSRSATGCWSTPTA